MPKRELTKTEKGVLGFFGALGAFFGIRHLMKAAPPEPGLAILWGIITDAETGAWLAGIEVTCNGYFVITDGNGRYEIAEIPPSTYTVTFTDPLGRYERLEVYMITIEAGVTRELNVTLAPRKYWIHGYIIDDITSQPIPSVRAEVVETGNYDIADGGGIYVIKDVPCLAGQDCIYTVRFSHPDYETKEAVVTVGQWQTGELNVELTALALPPPPPPPPPPTGYVDGLMFSYIKDNRMSYAHFLPFVPPSGSMSNVSLWIANTSDVRLPMNVRMVITYPNGTQRSGSASPTIRAHDSENWTIVYIPLNQRGTYVIEAELTTNGQLLDSKRWEMTSVDV